MIPELGQVALLLALAVALIQGTLPLVGAARGRADWMALARPAAQTQFLLVAFAFVCLDELPSCATTSRCSTLRRTRTARCRSPIASPACGAATKARCCCGC